mmetsp:Transcript_24414/g.58057  ORF Transcript_24414/g.58057 Transcript_24414/m.58057 type:complete len:81 (+) Transcript_24414:718-960(+)
MLSFATLLSPEGDVDTVEGGDMSDFSSPTRRIREIKGRVPHSCQTTRTQPPQKGSGLIKKTYATAKDKRSAPQVFSGSFP